MTHPTREDLDAAVKAGNVARHDFDGLSIYNYTPRCVYERAWDAVTMEARGLVFRGDDLIARPFPKFFNHNEPDAVTPEKPPSAATVKLDGVLGISYQHRGAVRWTTRGKLDSPPGKVAQRMWDDAHGDVEVPPDWTLLVEVIHPDTRIVIDYPFRRLTVLAARRISTGEYVNRERLEWWCESSGVAIVDRVRPDGLIGQASTLAPDREGWVLEWPDGYRLKVKGRAYLEIARLMQGMSPRRAADMWVSREIVPAALPEETRVWLAEQWRELDEEAEHVKMETEALTSSPHWRIDRRAFVAEVGTSHSLFGFAMQLWGGSVDWRVAAYRLKFGGKPR